MEGKTLAMAVGMTAAVAIALGMLVMYGTSAPPPPERPPPPPPPESLMNSVLKYSQPVYMGLIEEDAKKYKVPAPKLVELGQPNGYFDELKQPRRLKIKEVVDTAHLHLVLEVAKRKASIEGQTFAFDHVLLRIQNRTPRFLAYRVETSVPDKQKCVSKGDIAHNAIVIEPNQTIFRTECIFRSDGGVDLKHVEVIELLPLSAYYVGRLPATVTLYDPRTSAGHHPLVGTLCPQTFSWREIQDGLDRKAFGWRDVIDFYARHNCEEYSFFKNYRYRTDAADPLPARPLD